MASLIKQFPDITVIGEEGALSGTDEVHSGEVSWYYYELKIHTIIISDTK